MKSAIKIQLTIGALFLSATSFSSATEWTGKMSCGELQNSPNAKSVAPFTGAVTLTIDKSSAVLNRDWANGTEHSEGTLVRGQPLRLEGTGMRFKNPDGAWKIRAVLTKSGQRYEGRATIESRDGMTKYRDCNVSVETAEIPRVPVAATAKKNTTLDAMPTVMASREKHVAQQTSQPIQEPTLAVAAKVEYMVVNSATSPNTVNQYSYEPALVKLNGALISEKGESPDGKSIEFPALKLINGITVHGNSPETPTENDIKILHLILTNSTKEVFNQLKGKSVAVSGTLFHSDNGNHQTKVLINPTSIIEDAGAMVVAGNLPSSQQTSSIGSFVNEPVTQNKPANNQLVSSPNGSTSTPATPLASNPSVTSTGEGFGISAVLLAGFGGAAIAILVILGYRRFQKQSGILAVPDRKEEQSVSISTQQHPNFSVAANSSHLKAIESEPLKDALETVSEKSPESETSSEIDNSKTNTTIQNNQTSHLLLKGLGGIISLIFTGYALYQFFQFSPTFSELTAPPSELESVSIIGKSTRADFEKFKDSGGLTKNPSWYGLHVKAYQAVYNGASKTLSGQTFSVSGKSTWNGGIKMWMNNSQLSTQELRQVLTQVCRASEDQWKFTEDNRSFGTVESLLFQCSYSPSEHGQYEVFVGGNTSNSVQPNLTVISKPAEPESQTVVQGGWSCQTNYQINIEIFSDDTFILRVTPNSETEIVEYGKVWIKGDRLFRETTAQAFPRTPNGVPIGWTQASRGRNVQESNYRTEEDLIVERSTDRLVLKPIRLTSWDGVSTQNLTNDKQWNCTRSQAVQFSGLKEGVPSSLR